MVGRSAATSADELYAGGDKLACVAGHVFGRAQIDVAALNGTRHAGVGLGGERQGSDCAQSLDGVEHGHGTDAAVYAGDIHVPFGQARAEGLRIGAVEAVAVFIDGDVRDDGNFRVHIAAGHYGLMNFLEVAEGFQHEEVDPALDQSGNLLAKRSARFFKRSFAERLDANAERAD